MAISFEDNRKTYSLQIERMSEGGFVVADGYRGGDLRQLRFASTSIEEAMKLCKKKLDTEHADGK